MGDAPAFLMIATHRSMASRTEGSAEVTAALCDGEGGPCPPASQLGARLASLPTPEWDKSHNYQKQLVIIVGSIC
jgi:hypothetical protein